MPVKVGLTVILLVLLGSCTPAAPLKIGLIGPLSGSAAEVGGTVRNTVEQYFEQLNDAGGVLGHRLELVSRDDQNQAQTALRALQDLEAAGIRLFFTPMQSGSAAEVVAYANQKHLLLLSPTIAAQEFQGQDDYFLRVLPSSAEFGRLLSRVAMSGQRLSRPASLYDASNQLFAQSLLSAFEAEQAHRHQPVVWQGSYSADRPLVVAPWLQALATSRADALVLIAPPLGAADIIQQLHKAKSPIQVLLSPWSMTPGFLQAAGPAAEGVLGTTFFAIESNRPGFQAFRQAYQRRYQVEPAWMGAFGREAAQVLVEGLHLAGDSDPTAVKQAILRQRTFHGLDEAFDIDANGDAVRPLFLYQVKGGRFVAIN